MYENAYKYILNNLLHQFNTNSLKYLVNLPIVSKNHSQKDIAKSILLQQLMTD